MTAPAIVREVLPSGLRLLTERMPHVRSVSIGVWLARGSRHETLEQSGIAHFVEHMLFKGTATRSAEDIAQTIDSIGGQMDAFTSKEYTCFYAKVLDRNLEEAVDLLADIVLRPLFDPEELERERKVIVEEIRMVEDSPEELVYDIFSDHFYPRHPLGRPIQGTEKTVGGFSRRRLLRYFREVYIPANLLIVATGSLRHDHLAKHIRRAFGGMKRRRLSGGKEAPPRPRGGVVTRFKAELEQLHLLLGLPAFPENDTLRYPLFVLNALLGGTMSSRLFQKVREERGLAYSVYSAVNAFKDSGVMMVYAGTSPKQADELLDVILQEVRSLRASGPTPAEVDVAREHLKGSIMLSHESTSSRMSNLARQEIYHRRYHTPAQVLERLEKVRTEDVHRVAERVFRPGPIALAAVGRTKAFKAARKGVRL